MHQIGIYVRTCQKTEYMHMPPTLNQLAPNFYVLRPGMVSYVGFITTVGIRWEGAVLLLLLFLSWALLIQIGLNSE